MNTLPHRSAAIRLGIACAALLAASAVAARAEEVTKSFAVTGRANVRVDTNDGSVRVTSGDSKQVEFRVEYQGYELGKNLRVDAHQDGNKVELTARVTASAARCARCAAIESSRASAAPPAARCSSMMAK